MTEYKPDEIPGQPEQARLEDLKRKLVAFCKKYAAIAEQSIQKVRFMLLINILCVCWLAFYVMQLFHLSIISTVMIFLILGIPALLLLKLYLTLNDVIELPDQIQKIIEIIKGKSITLKSEIMDQLPDSNDLKQNRSKLKNLFSMSKSLLEIKQMIGDAAGISGAFASALLLASPLFVILIVLSTAITGLLAFMSLITGLFFIF